MSGLTIGVRYTLWLYDASKPENKGLRIESSPGTDPFSFQLGANQVIEGWDRGVPGMRVGGIRRLVVPPALAYGDTRRGVIPPNATLLFDIELVSVTTT
jgi:FKBP-type peptidyl-prolyl cis-trans isomerase FkpA